MRIAETEIVHSLEMIILPSPPMAFTSNIKYFQDAPSGVFLCVTNENEHI